MNQFDTSWSAGLLYTGVLPGRDAGQLGLAVSGVHNGGKFKRAGQLAGAPVNSNETAIELTYSDNLTRWISVQPDIQYVINPGTDPARDNAAIIGGRMTVSF